MQIWWRITILQKTIYNTKQTAMQINHEEANSKGSFFIKEADKQLAEMTYHLKVPGTMVIEHTWVDDSLRGKKVGNALVDKGVEFARQHQYKILPLCTFANKVLTRDKEQYADILQG